MNIKSNLALMAGVLTLSALVHLGITTPPSAAATGGTTLNDYFNLPTQPNWQDLFNADGSLRSLPDGTGAAFMPDNISAGTAIDMTAVLNGTVINAAVEPQHDLGNTYLFHTVDNSGNLVVYAAVERLGIPGGESFIEFTLSQAPYLVRQGSPWQIHGESTPGDLTVKMIFIDGALTAVDLNQSTATGDVQTLESFWPTVGAACTGQPNNFAFCSGALTAGLPTANQEVWDAWYQKIPSTPADQFAQIGINFGRLSGINPDTLSLTVRTPEDIVLAPATVQRRAQP